MVVCFVFRDGGGAGVCVGGLVDGGGGGAGGRWRY